MSDGLLAALGFIAGQAVSIWVLRGMVLARLKQQNGRPIECGRCGELDARLRVQEETMVLVLNTIHLFPKGRFSP